MSADVPSAAGHPAIERLLRRDDLPALAAAATDAFAVRGGEIAVRADGRAGLWRLALDPVPRAVDRRGWAALSAGVAQRHRALNAFLTDVYRASGRRRSDPDRAPEIVRAGELPGWAAVGSPGHDPVAVGMAWPGQPRIGLLGCDVVRTDDGRWLVQADDARRLGGLGPALGVRAAVAAGAPALLPPDDVADPAAALPVLRAALATAAPPAGAGPPSVAVLRSADLPGAAGEDTALAAALDVPLVAPADIWPRADGGVAVSVAGRRQPVDVLLLRIDGAELAATRTPAGQTIGALLGEGVRTGRLGLVDVPGNALADDPTTFAAVPRMIRFYLGEEPLLEQVPTWVLADPGQHAEVRDRLHELVVVPLGAYGGGPVVVGPGCTAAELAELEAAVAAAPHRFVARALVRPATAPALVGDRVLRRALDLRIFSAATGRGDVSVLDAPLSRAGDAVKDTWLLRT